MSVSFSSFLFERQGRYEPKDATVASLNRLDKIDFTGTIHLSNKTSKTDMIVVMPGDLVISGINVAKGAIAVYEGSVPIAATIHYSSYTYNPDRIDIKFLKRFLKSPAFNSALSKQLKGGIKTEIKAKQLLQVRASIPDLEAQAAINAHFESFEGVLNKLCEETGQQSSLLTQLRQSILQEAIEGKLTAGWRPEHPVVKGDPETDAAALLAQIQAETARLVAEGAIKKSKPLAPIREEEAPFGLPEGWVWTRLGEICGFITKGTTPASNEMMAVGEVPFLKVYNIIDQKIDFFGNPQFISAKTHKTLARSVVLPGDVVMNIVGPPLGKIAVVPGDYPEWNVNQALAIFRSPIPDLNKYLFWFLNEGTAIKAIQTQGVVGQDNISLAQCRELECPLPPLAEQQVIVERVEGLLAMVDELEQQVADRKRRAEALLQTVLADAFGEVGS